MLYSVESYRECWRETFLVAGVSDTRILGIENWWSTKKLGGYILKNLLLVLVQGDLETPIALFIKLCLFEALMGEC